MEGMTTEWRRQDSQGEKGRPDANRPELIPRSSLEAEEIWLPQQDVEYE